jgi:hypothetical protein
MPLNVFARLFVVGDQQVLITKEYDEEENGFHLLQRTEYDSVSPTLKVGFKTEEECDKHLEDYNQEDAISFIKLVQQYA